MLEDEDKYMKKLTKIEKILDSSFTFDADTSMQKKNIIGKINTIYKKVKDLGTRKEEIFTKHEKIQTENTDPLPIIMKQQVSLDPMSNSLFNTYEIRI